MNEALQYAHGHFVVNMNAGDSLLSIPTEALKTLLATDHDMLCCPVVTDGGFNHFPLWDERIKRFQHSTSPRMLLQTRDFPPASLRYPL